LVSDTGSRLSNQVTGFEIYIAPRNTPVKASELLHVLHAKALDDVSARIEIQ
jgi:hypothetical protein